MTTLKGGWPPQTLYKTPMLKRCGASFAYACEGEIISRTCPVLKIDNNNNILFRKKATYLLFKKNCNHWKLNVYANYS